jgi:hypothetical protein
MSPDLNLKTFTDTVPCRISGRGFESLVHRRLDELFPYSVLANLILFRPDHADSENYAYEIDNLMHYRKNEVDYLLVVESKVPPITISNKKWIYERTTEEGLKEKDARGQVKNHAKALFLYLQPIAQNMELRIQCCVVNQGVAEHMHAESYEALQFHLVGYKNFDLFLQSIRKDVGGIPPTFLRVAQSPFLSLLRKGVPVPTLGHPEIRNALDYIQRCRRRIDSELYRSFSPSKERWAINGTAGMGKSVLLAYAGCVMATDRIIESTSDVARALKKFSRAVEIRVPAHMDRRILICSMKRKQLAVLESLYHQFATEIAAMTGESELRTIKPLFRVWNDTTGIPPGVNVLIIDEAHDLSVAGQKMVAEWHNQTSGYLIIACDRHQKLHLIGSKAKIVEGLDFGSHTKRLNRIYRNPFPVYMAGLALMFRWMAPEGPKVIPSKTQLEAEFGLETLDGASPRLLALTMRNDAHPANAWSHTLSTFPSCAAAFAQLQHCGLKREEVLWVRFGQEDSDFDYEQLASFTYHNFCTDEASALADKYVKGQDFPIVVIEGFPDHMDLTASVIDAAEINEAEQKMWRFRRLLYLCCSRATGFLYLIANGIESNALIRLKIEIDELVSQLSIPINRYFASGKTWHLRFSRTELTRSIDVFSDDGNSLAIDGLTDPPSVYVPKISMQPPFTVKEFANALGLKPYKIIGLLNDRQIFLTLNSVLPEGEAKTLATHHGFELEVVSGI